MKTDIRQVHSNAVISVFFKKALSFKLYYIICLIVFGLAAFVINKYAVNVYEVNGSILLKQNNRSALFGSTELFKGAEFLQNTKSIENEVNMLNSFSLISSTITNLNLEVAYFEEKKGLITQVKELYLSSPFLLSIDKSHIQPINVPLYIDILTDSTFRITAFDKEASFYNYIDREIVKKVKNFQINGTYKFDQTIETDLFKISVSLNTKNINGIKQNKDRFFCSLQHLEYLTLIYSSRLKFEPISPLASIIKFHFQGENVDKITTFLNKYIETYLDASLEKKNITSVNTIKFIDSQISDISDSLNLAESNLRNYKSANQVMDLSFQGQRIFDQMSQIETEKANGNIQKRYYDYIIDLFNKNKDIGGIFPPSAMNVVDPIMNQMVLELISLNAERSNILNGNSQKNLFLAQIENKIKMQKDAILENVKNNLNTLNLSLSELNYRSEKFSSEISKLPKTQLGMVNIERKFKLNDAIYTFLLQKRSEAEITKASSLPDYEVLEPARVITSTLVSPKRGINYIISVFLALLFPTLFILIRDFFNDKITNLYEVEHLTKHEVIASIYRNRHKKETVVNERPRSSVAESFRTLRTNLLIKQNTDPSKVILVTSSLPREGKSFVSINLASSISAIGLKTLIIDCDLRRPTLHTKLEIDNSIGLSTYMVNKALVDDILLPIKDNLYFIPAGPILPNPTELIESGMLDKLFTHLKNNFDYIIIDTPPLGAVSDSYLLMKYCSHALLITRQNYTRKDVLQDVVKGLESNNLIKFDIVLNDLNYSKSNYGKYYGQYYSDEKNDGANEITKFVSKIPKPGKK